MDLTKLTTIVSLLVALSVASERLVEIIKGLFPFLNQQNVDPKKEGWRKAAIQFLAVPAGIITAFLAKPAIPDFFPDHFTTTLAVGLLASGGSGFWNSILTYVTRAKDIKGAEAENKRLEVKLSGASPPKA